MRIVTVRIGAAKVALPLADVLEVQRASALAPLPAGPVAVEGLLNLRGEVLPVLDLRERLGLPGKPLAPTDRFVVVHSGERRLVLRVDEVAGFDELDARLLEPGELPGVRRLAGVGADAEGVVLLCDIPALLAWDEAAALDRALVGAGAMP